MIKLPDAVFVATSPIDLRLSFDRLAGIIREQLGGDPLGTAVFAFHNRNRTHLKLLWHDAAGYRILYIRLDRGTYRIPLAIPAGARKVQVSHRELSLLLSGLDERLLREARRGSDGRIRHSSKQLSRSPIDH
jgi:transposase